MAENFDPASRGVLVFEPSNFEAYNLSVCKCVKQLGRLFVMKGHVIMALQPNRLDIQAKRA